MQVFAIRPDNRSGVAVRPAARSALLIATALGCSLSVLVAAAPEAAFAASDCGGATTVSPGQDKVTCTGAGNPYSSGIFYQDAQPNDLTVVLQGSASGSPVEVNTTAVTGVGAGALLLNNVTINSYAGSSVTAQKFGLYAYSHTGAVSVNNASTVNVGNWGVTAKSFFGDVTAANSGAITITPANALSQIGLNVGNRYGGVVTVNNSGTVSITGGGYAATGISAGGGNASTQVTNSASITITGSAATAAGILEGFGASGVVNNLAGGVISVTGADQASGISVRTGAYPPPADSANVSNADSVSAVATGAAGSAVGIQVQLTGVANGSAVVDLTGAGAVSATGYSATGVSVAATGNVAINGYGSTTITADSSGGGGAGVDASSSGGAVGVALTGAVTTTGDGATGIKASAYTGVTVAAGAVSTSGKNAPGVSAYTVDGPAKVTISGAVGASGAYSAGVVASSAHGNAYVTLDAGSSVSITGEGVTSGGPSAQASVVGGRHFAPPAKYTTSAVRAYSPNGTASVSGAGAVSATGAGTNGVMALGYAGATVNISGPVTATGAAGTKYGAGGVGVTAVSSNGPATATVGQVTAYNTGVFALSGKSDASVTVNGAVASSHGYGVIALAGAYSGASGASSVTVSATGSVTGQGGVFALAQGGASSVTNGGSISGGYLGALAVSYGSTATVVNSGTLTALHPGTNAKYAAAGAYSTKAAAVVDNQAGGVITGQVRISGATGSTFDNAGVWNAVGTSYIGTNTVAGVVNNSGTVNVAPTSTMATTVTVARVGTWNNSGRISLVNGHTGDVLNLGGAAFAGSGASSLVVDAALSAGTSADKLVVGAASGTTTVRLADTAPNAPAQMVLGGGPVVAQATSGTASTFTLAPVRKGFVNYGLAFDPTAVTWSLIGLPDHAAFETLKLGQLSQAFAGRSDDVWYQRMKEVRDARADGSRKDGFEVWGQVYGGSQDLGGMQGFSLSGFRFDENLKTSSNWAGVQAGVDHLSDWRGGKLLWGFTAGYLQQWTTFATGGDSATWAGGRMVEAAAPQDSVTLSGANVGAYLGYARGGWFLNGMAKVDFINDGVHLNAAPAQATTNSAVWGLVGELGYRWGGQRLFLEPVVRLAGGDTNVDRWSALGADMVYPDATNLQVQAGARVGGQAGWGPLQVSPWLGAYWVDETLGQNREQFSTGDQSTTLQDTAARGYGRVELGATAKSVFGLQGYARLSADSGSGVSGWSGDLGIRWRW